ncbi:PilZ domain-containing protein, partial [Limimaricola sp. ASW11-118]
GALGLAALAALAVSRVQRKRQRQAKRHAVNLPARIRSGTAETETRLIDISRQGAKLRLDAGFEPAGLRGVTILLGDRRIGATARWRNKHFLGVQFLRPLPDDAVAPILTQTDPGTGPEPDPGGAPAG